MAHPRVACHIGKAPIAIVAIEDIGPVASDVEVEIAVLVVVCCDTAHPVTRFGYPRQWP